MKRSTLIGILVVVAILLVGGGLLLANRSSTTTDTNTPAVKKTESASKPSNANTAPTNVAIANMAFSPANITIKKNTTVTWTNNDSVAHTVTENDGQDGPNSGGIDSGSNYSFTYGTVGTFKYHCAIHPNMTGTVTVTE